MIDVMRRIQPSPQHGENSMVLFNFLFKKIIHFSTSQCKISLFQQLPNTQLVRQLNARQPITMRNDQGFHPLLHLRVSNCPISRFPFQLIPENVLKVKFCRIILHHLVIKVISHCCEAPLLQCVAGQCPSHHKTTCGLKKSRDTNHFFGQNSTTKTSV